MAVFRLLHISDLHVSARKGPVRVSEWVDSFSDLFSAPGRPDRLDAAAELAYRYRSELDAILITGDLSHVGSERDLDAALRFVEAPVAPPGSPDGPLSRVPKGWHSSPGGSVWPSLKASGLPVLLFPGNHDRFLPSVPEGRSPGGVLFDRVFGHYWHAGQGVQCLLLPPKDGETLTIVAADCTLRAIRHCHLGGYLSQGRAYPDLVKALSEQSGDLENSAVLWALHFPPDDKVDLLHRLLDGEEVLTAAENSDVDLVLAGHLHKFRRFPERAERLEGFCAASAAVVSRDENNSLHLLRVEVEEHRMIRFAYSNLEYLDDVGEFVLTRTFHPRITRLRESLPSG